MGTPRNKDLEKTGLLFFKGRQASGEVDVFFDAGKGTPGNKDLEKKGRLFFKGRQASRKSIGRRRHVRDDHRPNMDFTILKDVVNATELATQLVKDFCDIPDRWLKRDIAFL